MKKLLPTLLVVVILAALGFYVGIYETKPQTPKRDTLYEVEQDEINKFRIEDLAKGTSVSCEKKESGWWITSPQSLEAESDTIDIVLRQLASPQVDRKLGPQENLASFNLKEPAIRVTLSTSGGVSHTILVGAKTPTGSAYFVKDQELSDVYTVAQYSIDSMNKTIDDLRNKTLMSFDPDDVTRMVIKRAKGGTLEFVRGPADTWALAKPIAATADRYAVDGLLNDMKLLKGTEIIEEPHAYSRYKLDQPKAEIIVYTATQTAQKLVLSIPDPEKKDEAYASSERLPFVFKLASAFVVDNATKDLESFRERLLFSVNRQDLEEAVINYGKLTIVCEKVSQDKWRIKEPADAKADNEMNEMLFEVIYARVEEFVSDTPKTLREYGLDKPRAKVLIRGAAEGNSFVFHFELGKRKGEHTYMKMAGFPNVYAVRKEMMEKVERFAEKVRSGGNPKEAK